MRRLPCAAREPVDDEVERDHDQQQHEGRGVGLLGREALARRRVVVDVAGQRAAGAAQRRRSGVLVAGSGAAAIAPSRMTTIAVSPAIRPMPSAVPVPMPGRAAGQQHAADRRPPWSCRARRRPRARGRGSPAAPRASRRPRAAARSATSSPPAAKKERPNTAPPSAVEGEEAEAAAAGRRAGRRSRARCSACRRRSRRRTRPPAPARPGGRTPSARPRSPTPSGAAISVPTIVRMHGAEERVEEAARLRLVDAPTRAALMIRSKLRYCEPLARPCRSRSPRRSAHSAMPAAQDRPSSRCGRRSGQRAVTRRAGARVLARSPSWPDPVLAHAAAWRRSRRARGTCSRRAGRRERVERLAERLDREALGVVDDRRRERPRRLEEEGEAVERVGREADRARRPSRA